MSDGMLTVGGTHLDESEEASDGKKRSSRSEFNFMRRVSLPSDADVDAIDTRFSDGTLKLTVPKIRV